jgi:RNA polymerase sigma factor (TIGR02999 family)
MTACCESITKYLQQWRDGDPDALDLLTTAIYSELRRMASGILAGKGGGTVEPTVLVHELYIQLPGIQRLDWTSRGQFLNIAARMMRNVLVDYARRKRAAKRGSGQARLTVTGIASPTTPDERLDVILVHDLLEEFAVEYPRHAKVVELRFFGGLSEDETVAALEAAGVQSSIRTVSRDWSFAKAWLQNRLTTP